MPLQAKFLKKWNNIAPRWSRTINHLRALVNFWCENEECTRETKLEFLTDKGSFNQLRGMKQVEVNCQWCNQKHLVSVTDVEDY